MCETLSLFAQERRLWHEGEVIGSAELEGAPLELLVSHPLLPRRQPQRVLSPPPRICTITRVVAIVLNVAKTRRRAKPGATSDATMSTNPRHTRTAATNGPDGDRTTRATSTEKSRAAKTFLDNWVEPSLPPPAPSFTDHPHLSIERYGVLENMAPLGTMPTAKAKKIGKDTPRRAVKADESEVEASTSRELVTPEPQINIIRKRSQSGKADDEEWNPRTPTAQARKSATKTKQGAEAGAMMSQSPHRNKEERDMFITDRAVQFAVEDAILDYRWPTAYALRTMYNDHRINPRIRRLFMLIFTDQATEEEKTEFQCLMTYKKKEGAKDNKAQRYFDEHDNLYSPVNLFQKSWSFSGASKRASTEVANRASASPHKDTSHVSKKAKVAHAHQTSSHTTPHIHLNVSGSSSASGKPAEMNGTSKGKPARQAQNGTTTVSVATRSRSVSSTSSLSSLDEAVLESEMADISGEAGQGEEISETIHSTKALRAREEPGRSAEKTARNQKAKQPITRHSTHAPRPNPHTFTAVNTKPPAASTPSSPPALFPNLSTNANNRNGNGDNVMRPYLDENYALPQSLSLPPQNLAPRSHKKGAAAALRRITTPRDEEIIRRKKEAKSRTDGAISTRQSFVRTPVQGPDLGSGSEAGDGGAAVVSQPTTRQVLRFRRRNRDDESDNHSSPTRLSFQPDLAPGSTRNSRANTPIAGARATRKAKSSGARMKTSPKKNPQGTSAGIPRASGQRDSPVSGGPGVNFDENDEYCSACGGNGDLVCCDGCTRAFHLICVDPPMESVSQLPPDWYCVTCGSLRTGPGANHRRRGLFGELTMLVEKRNPSAFHLPLSIRGWFEGVRTGPEGEYEEGNPPKKKQEEAIDFLRLKDAKGNPVICSSCSRGSGGTLPIIPCSFCGLHWHLDCLDPPLANPPAISSTRPWKCPCHIDDLLEFVPGALGPAHRFRRVKGRSAIKPALSRGIKNDGHVEVEPAMSEDETKDFFEDREYGRVYMLPEKGIILDFISRVHAKRRTESALVDPYAVAPAPAPAAPPLTPRNIADQQAALNLAQLATQSGHPASDSTNQLITALLSEAAPSVIDLVARADTADITGRVLAKMDVQALRAVRGLIDGVLAGREEGGKRKREVEEEGKEEDEK
ncbi:hypothetical protein V496_01351 [Pseudogymnoascus sp. VKM F-4515 (FW-2607)]|nr:hypothetical protein V496_01351 [Pseudogymnoascus sp. VKM F-4515 (FW-2607)]